MPFGALRGTPNLYEFSVDSHPLRSSMSSGVGMWGEFQQPVKARSAGRSHYIIDSAESSRDVAAEANVSVANVKVRSAGLPWRTGTRDVCAAAGEKGWALIDQAAMIAIMRGFSDTTDLTHHAQKTRCR
jgi:hypothetical protein